MLNRAMLLALAVLSALTSVATALDKPDVAFKTFEIDAMYPHQDDQSIKERKNGHKAARTQEKKDISEHALDCVLYCRDEAPPGLRPYCIGNCTAHEAAGLGVPFAWPITKAPEPAAAAFAFPFSFLDAFAIVIGICGSGCIWHSAHFPFLSWLRVYWLGHGIGLLGASTGILAYQHGRRV